MVGATGTTNASLPFRVAEFETLTEGLDYAARGETGVNFYSPRGELLEALSYRDLRDRAISLALSLTAAGYERGTRFAIIADTHSYFHTFFFACQYAGLIPVPLPLNIHMGGRDAYVARLRGMLRESGAKAVVALEEMAPFLMDATAGLDVTVGTPESFLELPATNGDLRPFDADGPCYIQYSSGSTSAPRGVFITQHAITSNARGIGRDGLRLVQGDRSTSWLPLYHDMGLVGFCITPAMSQITVDYLSTASFARRPLVWLKLLTKTGGTISFSPTFGYELCARRGLNGSAAQLELSRWRVAGIGGEMVRPDVLKAFADTFGVVGFSETAFLPSYGLAESTLAVSFPALGRGVEVDRIDRDIFASTGRAVPVQRRIEVGSRRENAEIPVGGNLQIGRFKEVRRGRDFVLCGKALPGHKIEIRDDHENVLPDRRVGRVLVQGPSVMAGYYKSTSSTSGSMVKDGWLDTGDLGYSIDGNLVITGRRKDLIIQNGRNIWPQDIEWTVEKLEQVRPGDAACFSVGSDDAETEIVVVVQGRVSGEEAREALVKEISSTVYRSSGVHCRVALVPTRSLTFTSSGKLSRAAVKADYLAGNLEMINSLDESLPLSEVSLPTAGLQAKSGS
jgi:fatty-acyl-CoA synthase